MIRGNERVFKSRLDTPEIYKKNSIFTGQFLHI